MTSHAFTYASLANVGYIEEMYQHYRADPTRVDSAWQAFFQGMEFGEYREHREVLAEASRDIRIYNLVNAYRTFGHLLADVNPIETQKKTTVRELELGTLGFKEEELTTLFPTGGLLEEEEAPLQEIIALLQQIYCQTIGVEYMGFQSPELAAWLQKEIEPSRFRPRFSIEKKRQILHELNKAELFEIFLHTKYVGQKRFSLEGGETLIPIMHEIIETGAEIGMDEFVIGMAHRGRLNVLANILHKSYSAIFGEFEDFYDPALTEGTGDVKYHKGFSANVTTQSGKQVHIGVTANPSHLESVNPVVEGKTRAKQIRRGDVKQTKILPILVHGDASLAGQGVIYEVMQLYRLPGYATGGTLHIVVNNQIGFTTLPKDSRSTPYCTDIARSFAAPVFHVNAEDPEGCIYATQLALEIRQRFQCDVFIDLNCYRKYGHNEGDEPAFTQPLEYQLIRKKKSIREIYRDHLIEKGVVERELAKQLEDEFRKGLHHELEELKLKKEVPLQEMQDTVWTPYKKGTEKELLEPVNTAVESSVLKEMSRRFCALPESFHVHSKVKKLFEHRLNMVEAGGEIDWGMGEHLAMGSLLSRGTPIRLAGQDSRRGTFSQRHALLVDQENDAHYIPLAHLSDEQGRLEIYDSPLTEYAGIGFEFGYSLAYPSALVMWEAQYGDFANGGQILIDTFIAGSEQKWGRYSGLVLLLPHGYEGGGPEHSSARIERFLQLSGEANMQVVNPTTPAQYFHLLRRQVLRMIRKPLIIFTPKGLLRHPLCVSPLEAFTSGTFQEILDDPQERGKVRRVLLCSGRIYYDLVSEFEKRKINDMALVRIEQLYPLHKERLLEILKQYKGTKECFWVQEEPENMGGWSYIHPLLLELLPGEMKLQFVGRNRSASSATGRHGTHVKEQEQLMEKVFS